METIHLLHHSEVKSKNPLQNAKGMTITELLVVLALVGVVALGNATFLFDFTNQLKRINSASEGDTELSVLNIATVNILKKSAASFNKVDLRDDNNRNFFDYYPDVPYSTIEDQAKNSAQRSFTMTPGQANRYFYLLQSEEAEFDSVIFDPMFAYRQSSVPANQLLNGTVQYVGLNSIPDLKGTTGSSPNGSMTQIFQTRWAPGKLFMLSCPTYLRPIVGGSISIMTAPRFASYLGKVSGSDLGLLSNAESKVNIINSHPITLANYTNVDGFMRTLPAVGGAAPFVKIEPVTMVRFELRVNSVTNKSELWLQELTNGQYKDVNMLLSGVSEVKFVRKAITLPIISLEVKR
ncbi:prepilin-type N-terminal cleavage/methylation domain-containing protein [Bdellovibrio sp. GT3]|uniref:prepilin-type N-terminal cleavage/methylation domain-containing protein n=1 Tax=Bdellovibrio sp. GT3 TaxID=3136282 RepID=UPI0030F2EA6A